MLQFEAETLKKVQSNNIDGINSYKWLMRLRENINYRFRTFYEPDVPGIWEILQLILNPME
jgi:hypothetical protein